MSEPTYDHIMDNLRKVLGVRGRQTELAELSGISQNTLSRWMTGDREPRLGQLARLFDTLGVMVIFPWEVAGDFSEDINRKNNQIRELREVLESTSKEKLMLEGENRLLNNQLDRLADENARLRIELHLLKNSKE